MSRDAAAAVAAAASAWRTVLSSSASRNPSRCLQGRGASEALLGPASELRTGRWLAASTTAMSATAIGRSASTLPRRIGASPGIFPASSIRGWKANCRGFAAEPGTREEKEERKGDDEGGGGGGERASTSSSSTPCPTATTAATSWGSAGWSLDSCATLPNAISAARALSAPFLFRAITRGDWEVAGALLVFGAASDWADGAAARFLDRRRRTKQSEGAASSTATASASASSSSSPLGTYLDPLADKVFIGAAVAAAAGWGGGDGGGGFFAASEGGGGEGDGDGEGEEGEGGGHRSRRWPLLPGWLAAAIICRDVVLVAGSMAARLRQFEGGRWPGGPEFFRLVDGETERRNEEGANRTKPSAAPRIRPLFVSKLNTALQFATVGAAVADSGGWLEAGIGRARSLLTSSPATTTRGAGGGEGEGTAAAAEAAAAAFASGLGGSDVVAALAAATAAMTAASGWAYASTYLKAKKRRKS